MAAEGDDADSFAGCEYGFLAEEEEVLADFAGGGCNALAYGGGEGVAAEGEVGWEGDGDFAVEETVDIGGVGGGEDVAEEEGEGEVVFGVEEGDFGEGFGETAVSGAGYETGGV